MSQKPDDLEAVRTIVTALDPFDETERERIIRWVSEKLGIKTSIPTITQNVPPAYPASASQQPIGQLEAKDIKSFLLEKNPKTANQLVATVAYYYKFEAPVSERKPAITADDLVYACRKADRERQKFPRQVLINASASGLVDKVGKGTYEINAVGENLVAVTMPNTGNSTKSKGRTKKSPAKTKKNSAKKK